MANNRLWIRDTENGEVILLAKGWGSGWKLAVNEIELQKWLDFRDVACAFSNEGETKLKLESDASVEGGKR